MAGDAVVGIEIETVLFVAVGVAADFAIAVDVQAFVQRVALLRFIDG